ncbi:Speckle-type POZ protein-like B [Araneus ventricosus]|uniref:Speckle-type POZ protein-like B n=1 Tax=Araneus ventricosus TaxID=182803 RepID=A0A4Y2IIK2_ARAVE|nr:Speckle-type POZ protein-like B [Araneus ventricosus]
MLRFPIEWKELYGSYDERRSAMISNLNLNGEWTLACVWNRQGIKFKLDFIEIHRKITCEETCEKTVSGTLSLRENGHTVSTQTFSKSVKSGSSFTKLINLRQDISFIPWDVRKVRHSLHGVVNILSVSEKCSSDFESKGCKMCIQPKSLVQLSDDFERLLNPQTSCFSDVNLKCDSASIPAHKLILSARSPVFAAMFKNPMKETHENEVDITDIDASVLRAMITYIYTGKTSGLTVSSASDLLFAAEKYQLLDLKRVCCDFLKESISLQNVMWILVLGDLHAEDLKSFSVDYICKNYTNFAEFEKIEEWESLRKVKPTLALDILTALLKSEDEKKEG